MGGGGVAAGSSGRGVAVVLWERRGSGCFMGRGVAAVSWESGSSCFMG